MHNFMGQDPLFYWDKGICFGTSETNKKNIEEQSFEGGESGVNDKNVSKKFEKEKFHRSIVVVTESI